VILLQLGVALSIQSTGKGLSVLGIYLVVMLYFLVPWTSVNLTDYFFVRKGRYAIPHFFMPKGNIYGSWGLRGIAAYAIGFVAMIPFFYIYDGVEQREVYVGPLARALGSIDIAWLVGLLVSGLAYYWFSRSIDLASEETVIRQIEKTSPQYTTGDSLTRRVSPATKPSTAGR
jgi:purine-cytosine permease-like protein